MSRTRTVEHLTGDVGGDLEPAGTVDIRVLDRVRGRFGDRDGDVGDVRGRDPGSFEPGTQVPAHRRGAQSPHAGRRR